MTDPTEPVLTEADDEVDAAAAFLSTLLSRADSMAAGVYPLWHGWALREAFLAGARWERGRSDASTPPPGMADARERE